MAGVIFIKMIQGAATNFQTFGREGLTDGGK